MIITFVAHGRPAPQGSKRHVGNGIMVESSKAVKPWREAVKWAAIDARPARADDGFVFAGPVLLEILFLFPRPKSHYRSGRNAHLLKDDAPDFVCRTPDLSKLVRSSEDAVTDSGLWRDDAQVVITRCSKVWSDTAFQGAEITITDDLTWRQP